MWFGESVIVPNHAHCNFLGNAKMLKIEHVT